jgi:2-amino-4-hydroxy-6-hydroxymethyldihydropteridine diphosphokinase
MRLEGEHSAVIGLGSNLGDRAAYLLRAVERLLARAIPVVKLSSIYETEPVDFLDQSPFLNMAALVQGPRLPVPRDLLSICLKIEADLGRDRLMPKGPRGIDLDLLIYDDLIIEDRSPDLDLILPHPRMHERRFVLVPLVELLPEGMHPLFRTSYSVLLSNLQSPGRVELYQG